MPISSFRRLHERNESNTEMENGNLYPQEPLYWRIWVKTESILIILEISWKAKLFSKLYKLVIIKLSVKIFPMRPSWSDSKF